MDIPFFIISVLVFTAVMLAIALKLKTETDFESFFAANRNATTLTVAISAAASWQWADNLFSTSQIGYDYGVYGILWFAGTSFLSFIIFGFLANTIREQTKTVITIPDFVSRKTNNARNVHIALVIATILYQFFTLVLGATVTGLLLNSAFGIPYIIGASSAIIMALSYSLISGLKASIVTDVVQFFMMLILMLLISFVIFTSLSANPVSDLTVFGTDQKFQSFLQSDLLFELGIPLAVIILSQPIVDQMIFQRLVSLNPSINPFKPFFITGLICGGLVLLLGFTGIIGQYLMQAGAIAIDDTQLTVVRVIEHGLPQIGVFLFVIAFLGSVFSTTDSVYSSISSLVSVDLFRRYFQKNSSDEKIIQIGRFSMIIAAALAVLISFLKLEILWILFIIGAAGGTIVVPILFAIFAKALRPRIVTAAIGISLIISLPLSIYANMVGNSILVSTASLSGIVIGLIFCSFAVKRS